jgi:hypothetical protein
VTRGWLHRTVTAPAGEYRATARDVWGNTLEPLAATDVTITAEAA